MPPNQRKLAKNGCIGGTNPNNRIFGMMCPPGDKEIIDFTLHDMVTLSIEEEVEVEEEREWLQERQMDRPNGGFSRGNGQGNKQDHNNKLPQTDLN